MHPPAGRTLALLLLGRLEEALGRVGSSEFVEGRERGKLSKRRGGNTPFMNSPESVSVGRGAAHQGTPENFASRIWVSRTSWFKLTQRGRSGAEKAMAVRAGQCARTLLVPRSSSARARGQKKAPKQKSMWQALSRQAKLH
ncbi:hypothetical protein B0H66DRAFT_340284 [Apodospora peruviana]|uniref:Secreted protein n=1 Tax=Apodospora peruviana TaxID=516989 RepID=A0AAE0M1F2_9PEZI|nr:hypothetical protein B0H66DRAFT_340284 [Apodospora peruviana]